MSFMKIDERNKFKNFNKFNEFIKLDEQNEYHRTKNVYKKRNFFMKISCSIYSKVSVRNIFHNYITTNYF